MRDRNGVIKIGNKWYRCILNEELNGQERGREYKSKISDLKSDGFITLNSFLKTYKIKKKEKTILKNLNANRLYIQPSKDDKIPKKVKKKKDKDFDNPWKVDKEQLLKYGPGYKQKCYMCEKECKMKADEDGKCDGWKIKKGTYMSIYRKLGGKAIDTGKAKYKKYHNEIKKLYNEFTSAD